MSEPLLFRHLSAVALGFFIFPDETCLILILILQHALDQYLKLEASFLPPNNEEITWPRSLLIFLALLQLKSAFCGRILKIITTKYFKWNSDWSPVHFSCFRDILVQE